MISSSVAFNLLIMLLLLIANGFFVAVEFALVTVRRSRVQEMVDHGNKVAMTVQKLQKDLDFSVAGAQLGITIASLALGWVAEESVHQIVQQLLNSIPGTGGWKAPPGLGIGISFVMLSMMHVIIGEQVPKSWALRLPEQIALVVAIPFRVFCFITSPLIFLMNKMALGVLSLMRIPPAQEGAHAIGSPEEFSILFEQSKLVGAIAEQEHELLNRSLELKNHDVRYLMIQRGDIEWLDLNLDYGTAMKAVIHAKHSRMVVSEDHLDRVLGWLDNRDVLSRLLQGEKIDFRESAQHILVVPETRNALLVLKDFQENNCDIAVVMDEFGSIRGLITINDVLASAVGDIPAMFDEEAPQVSQEGEGEWIMDGLLDAEEFRSIVGLRHLPEMKTKYYTLGGFVTHFLKRIPEAGETFEYEGLKFEILELDNYRVSQVKVTRLPKHPTHSADSDDEGWQLPKAS